MVDKFLSGKKEKMKNVRVPAVFIQRSIFLEMIEKGKTLHEVRIEIGKVLTGKPPCNKTLSSWRKKYLNKTFSINDKRKGRTNVCPTKYRKLGQAFVKSGCRSARQFSKDTGIPRSSVTYALHKAGMHYGNATQVPKILNKMPRKKRVEYWSRSEFLQLPINLNLLENLLTDTLHDVECNYYRQTSRRSHIGHNDYNRVRRCASRRVRVRRCASRRVRVRRCASRRVRVRRCASRRVRVKRCASCRVRVKRCASR